MRKIFILFLSFFLSSFNPLNVSALSSLKPRITPETEAEITYVSSPEEYLDSISDPKKTTVNIIRDLNLTDLNFKNEIIVDGFNRIINFNNRSISVSPENDLTLNYKTENPLTLRAKIGTMVYKIDALENNNLLYKATKNGSGRIENPDFTEKILIDGETLSLEENPELIKDGKTVARFSKTVSDSNDINFFLELNNYSGDNIEFLNFPNYAYMTILLSGENEIKTEKEVGIKIENTELTLESASETATLNINVNSSSDTAIGIARGLENPEDQQDLIVASKNLNLNFSLTNQTPSDSPFLTGFYARHGDIFLSESSKINLDLSPNLISEEISSTNNLTGATTELDGQIIIYRNNLTVNNPKGTYGFWSGNVTYIDGNTSGLDAYTDLDSDESKIIVKNSPAALTNRKNINDLYYNTQNYVEKITEDDKTKTFTLRNLVKMVFLDYDDPGEFYETELDSVLENIKSSLRFKNFPKVELENLSIEKTRAANSQYYLKIDLRPVSRFGFKENCKKSYSYKDIFIQEEEHENQVYLNNEETENYVINSVDSMTIFAPLSVLETPNEPDEPEPTEPAPEIPDAPEPETQENPETPEEPTPEVPEKPAEEPVEEPELPLEEVPETSSSSPALYFILFFASFFSLLLISKKSLL